MLDKPREEQAQVNQIIKAECRSCDRITNHLILACFEQLEHEYVDGATENELCRYQIAQCKGCDLLALLLEVWTPHGEIIQPFEGSDISSYPPSASKSAEATDNLRKPLPPNEVKMLPDNLRRIYRETLAAFNASLPVLTGIGIRAILEAVAKKENAPGEKLEAKVDYLLSDATERSAVRDAQKDLKKTIDDVKNETSKEKKSAKGKEVDEANKRLKDVTKQAKGRRDPFVEQTQVLHSLRFMGNAAAHEIMPHAQDELSTALEIVEILLKIFYVLPDKGKTLPTKQ